MRRPAGTHKRTESERHAALAASSGAGWSGVNPALFSVIYCPVIVRCGFRRSPAVCAENLSGAVSARYLTLPFFAKMTPYYALPMALELDANPYYRG
jgi:hypothetical protein